LADAKEAKIKAKEDAKAAKVGCNCDCEEDESLKAKIDALLIGKSLGGPRPNSHHSVSTSNHSAVLHTTNIPHQIPLFPPRHARDAQKRPHYGDSIVEPSKYETDLINSLMERLDSTPVAVVKQPILSIKAITTTNDLDKTIIYHHKSYGQVKSKIAALTQGGEKGFQVAFLEPDVYLENDKKPTSKIMGMKGTLEINNQTVGLQLENGHVIDFSTYQVHDKDKKPVTESKILNVFRTSEAVKTVYVVLDAKM